MSSFFLFFLYKQLSVHFKFRVKTYIVDTSLHYRDLIVGTIEIGSDRLLLKNDDNIQVKISL